MSRLAVFRFFLAGILPTTLPAQDTSATHGFCWIAHPLPKCRATAMLHFSVLAPVAGVTLGEDPASGYPGASSAVALDVGVLWNLSKKWAIGFNGYALGVEDARYGLLVTGRYWVSRAVAVDFAPGITLALAEAIPGEARLPGFAGRLGITWKEWIGLDLRVDALRVAGDDFSGGFWTHLPEETQVGWYLGAHAGTRAAPAIAALLLVVTVIAAATW